MTGADEMIVRSVSVSVSPVFQWGEKKPHIRLEATADPSSLLRYDLWRQGKITDRKVNLVLVNDQDGITQPYT